MQNTVITIKTESGSTYTIVASEYETTLTRKSAHAVASTDDPFYERIVAEPLFSYSPALIGRELYLNFENGRRLRTSRVTQVSVHQA